ncbi:exonuclease RecJ [Halobaculum limi]|uniref:exonuclease RecJ n=1 Tax=Halobaculum limi TaxID=3031916 RepID=UPI0024058052|nr:exonuclease RecJ [Halobaculum sp. YSMS11]
MSTAADANAGADPERVASALSAAEFVRVYARPTGDTLAAAGLLANALRERDTAFQVRSTRDSAAPDGHGTALALGWTPPNGTGLDTGDQPVSSVAAAVVAALGVDPDPLVGLAGVVAAEAVPGDAGSGSLLEAAERRGIVERRPGVAVPTADIATGLAHSTLVRAPFSGDPEAAQALVAELDLPADPADDDYRRLASALALDVTTDAPMQSVGAVERALRPYETPTGPFATLGGYADVLCALAREQPGLGVSVALGADATEAAVTTWREHARRAHGLLDDPTTGRYDGVFVARVETDPADTPALSTAARLLRDYQSPEPAALVVSDDAAAAAGDGSTDVTAALRAGVDATSGEEDERDDPTDADVVGHGRAGDARFGGGDVTAFIGGFREALR